MPKEVASLKLRDYERIRIGREESQAEKWDYVRSIEAAVINFGGMGAKKFVKSTEARPIPIIDNANIIIPIKNIQSAIKFLNKF